ncbi:MAG: hypothetical protein ACK504_02750 [Bacteroidota bacterium]
MNSFFKLLFLVFFIGCLSSCKHNPLDIDTSHVNQKTVVFKRLDKDIVELNQQNIEKKTDDFQKKYSSFYLRYVTSILNQGGKINDSSYNHNTLAFIADRDMKSVFRDIPTKITDNYIELLGEELTEVLKRFKFFFPNRKTPKQFVTFMSGFNYNVVYVDSTIGIGLEMYLGSNSEYYNMLQFPKFRTRIMNKEHLLTDVVRGWLLTEFDNADPPANNLLNHMIFYGKIFYACDGLLPNVHDSLKFGYTTKQLITCKQYEKNYWGFFVKDNKLFDNDLKIISEFTSDGPFTRAISNECPPRIAMWLGRQIVKSYMEHNDKVTLNDLMNETDAQKILSKSKYKP